MGNMKGCKTMRKIELLKENVKKFVNENTEVVLFAGAMVILNGAFYAKGKDSARRETGMLVGQLINRGYLTLTKPMVSNPRIIVRDYDEWLKQVMNKAF